MRTPLAVYLPQSCWAHRTSRHDMPGFDIVDDAGDTESLLELTGKQLPELVLPDSGLPGVYIEDLLPRLHAIVTHPIVII
jgi:hypothetical protein